MPQYLKKISPFLKLLSNAKTKLEIYSNFRGLLRLSKLQLLTAKLTELLSLGMASLSRHIWQIFCSSFVAIDCCCIEQLSPHKHFQTPNLFLILCNIKSYFSKGSFNNYVDRILTFFAPPAPLRGQKQTFFDTLPLILSTQLLNDP